MMVWACERFPRLRKQLYLLLSVMWRQKLWLKMLHCIWHFTTKRRGFKFCWPVQNMRTQSGKQYRRPYGRKHFLRPWEDQRGEADLSVILLDLGNCLQICFLLDGRWNNVSFPKPVQRMTIEYYKNFKIRFTKTDFTTHWKRLEKRITAL